MPSPRVRDTQTALKLVELRVELYRENAAALARRLYAGEMTIADWHAAMKQELKDLHGATLVISRGGERANVTQADWGRVGRELRDQYGYLDRFAGQIETSADMALLRVGNMFSEQYVVNRADLYGGVARATFWRGVTYNLLPQQPGDGKTQCRTNCRCYLQVEPGDTPDAMLVYWRLTDAEHCDDCLRLAQEWNPLVVQLPAEMVESAGKVGLDLRATIGKVLLAEFAGGHLHRLTHRKA